MAKIPLDKITFLLNGYCREQFELLYRGIAILMIFYLNGDEGVPMHDPFDNDNNNACIAKEHNGIHQPRRTFQELIDIISPQYFVTQNPIPTRQEFCYEMKNSYNVGLGVGIKIYDYVHNIRTNPEGTGLKAKDDAIAIDGGKSVDDSQHTGLKKVSKVRYIPNNVTNICIPKQLINDLCDLIEERFESESVLHHYIEKSALLQMNDGQMMGFMIWVNNKQIKLSVVNYDLHCKCSGNILYGIIKAHDDGKMMNHESWWQLDQFLTHQQILQKYGIELEELPKSSRKSPQFERQLYIDPQIYDLIQLINDTDWLSVTQIRSNNIKCQSIVTMRKDLWLKECKKSFLNIDLKLIPVVVHGNGNHWVEWVKIIYIESQNSYTGISCKHNEDYDEWIVQSICLDSHDIYNKHRLSGLRYDYCQNIPQFSWKQLNLINNIK